MQVKELDLDGVKCGGEIDFGDYDFSALEVLTISEAGLTSLKNFPTLPNLLRVNTANSLLSRVLTVDIFSWTYAKTEYPKDWRRSRSARNLLT